MFGCLAHAIFFLLSGSHIGGAGIQRQKIITSGIGTAHDVCQRVAVVSFDGGAKTLQSGLVTVEGSQHRYAVVAKNVAPHHRAAGGNTGERTEEPTSELKSLMRNAYAVF